MNDKRNLKISILGSRGIPAKYGGFETFVENLSKRLVKMGVDVIVFCPSTNEYKEDTYLDVKLNFTLNLEKYLGQLGTILYDLLSLLKAAFSDSTIIYMLGYSSSIFCIFPKILGKKIIVNTDGLEWKRSKWGFFTRAYLKLSEWFSTQIADVLISDSLGIKKYYEYEYQKDTAYITYGEDVFTSKNKKVLSEFKLKPRDYYLVVARLEPENNIHTIVKGFVSSNSKKKLFLITNLRKSKYLDELMDLTKIDKRIVWYGPLYNKEKLNELRANAFAYIHGHSVGGTNPSLLESMACGSPVIAFDVPFNREVSGQPNFFFKDENQLRSTIDEVEASKSESLAALGVLNQDRIRNFYNWNNIVKQYYDLFKGLKS